MRNVNIQCTDGLERLRVIDKVLELTFSVVAFLNV